MRDSAAARLACASHDLCKHAKSYGGMACHQSEVACNTWTEGSQSHGNTTSHLAASLRREGEALLVASTAQATPYRAGG